MRPWQYKCLRNELFPTAYGDQTIPLMTDVPGDVAEEGEEYGDPATGVCVCV
jgi:hypothetical protein